MTLSQLMEQCRNIMYQVTSTDIPIKDKNGNDIELDLEVIGKDDGSCQVSHIELKIK